MSSWVGPLIGEIAQVEEPTYQLVPCPGFSVWGVELRVRACGTCCGLRVRRAYSTCSSLCISSGFELPVGFRV